MSLAAIALIAGCSGAPQGTAPAASAVPGNTVTPTVPLSSPASTLLETLSPFDLAPDDLAFLAATTFEAPAAAAGTATVVGHLASGDTVTVTVSIAPADGGSPGLVTATSSTTPDRIEVHLEYLVAADGMSDEVRESLVGIVAAARAVANANARPILTAEVSVYKVGVDWTISKVSSTLRDTSIRAFLEKAAPGKAGDLMRLVKAAFAAEKGAALSAQLDAKLAELEKLEECARNPTNPLTIKHYDEEPGARDRILEQIDSVRNDLIANTVVMQLGVLNSFMAGFGPKWLGYAIGPGTSWSKATLEELNKERIDEVRRAVPKCECALVTDGLTAPLLWHGERRNSLESEWLIQGESNTAGYQETFLYRAVIDPRTNAGTYKYEAIGSIGGGTITKNGHGVASVAMQPDGSAIMTMGGIDVTSTIVAAGTTQTVTLPIPATAFTWKPVKSASCDIAG